MTNNKMPVVGERYRNKLNSKDYFLASINTIFRECSNHILGFEFFLKIPSEEVDKVREAQNPYFRTSVVYDRFDYFWTDFEPIPQDPISQPSIPVKEERLPEVGREYKFKKPLIVTAVTTNGMIYCESEVMSATYKTDEFLKMFEEIPNNLQKPSETIDYFSIPEELSKKLDEYAEKKYSDECFTRRGWHRDCDRQAMILTITKEEILPFNKLDEYLQKPSEVQVKDKNNCIKCGKDCSVYFITSGMPDKYYCSWECFPAPQVKKSILSNEVREAMERLRNEYTRRKLPHGYKSEDKWNQWYSCYLDLRNEAINLLTLLESMDKPNIPEKGDYSVKLKEEMEAREDIAYANGFNAGEHNSLLSQKDKRYYEVIKSIENRRLEAKKVLKAISKQYCDIDCARSDIAEEFLEKEKGDCGIVEDAKEETFTQAFLGDLIEYEGKKYACIVGQTNYLPDQTPHAWEEKDWSGAIFKHKKVKKYGNNQVEEEKKSEEEKPKSIWKDTSELAELRKIIPIACLISDEEGKICLSDVAEESSFSMGKLEKWNKFITLADFIKHIDSLEQRINKLEGK